MSHQFYFAQGALVGPSPPGGKVACALAHGALVGAIGPGGKRDVSWRDAVEVDVGVASLLAAAHGAVVVPIKGDALVAGPGVAQGALVPKPTFGRAVEPAQLSLLGATGRPCGPEVECAVMGGGTALGSHSKLNREPKGKCWTTGNFDRTSALYIFTMP